MRTRRNHTPDRQAERYASTETRTRFFEAFDHKDTSGRVPAQLFFEDFGIPKTTAYA